MIAYPPFWILAENLARAGMERDRVEITVPFDKEIFENSNRKFWLNGSCPKFSKYSIPFDFVPEFLEILA